MAVDLGDFESRFITKYPGKALYTLLAIVIYTLKFNWWLIKYIPRSTRPHHDWTLSQCVRINVVRAFLDVCSKIELKTPLSLAPGWREGKRFEVVEPAKEAFYVDVIAKDPEVRPQRTGITWWPARPASAADAGLVALYFHGGAYAIGDGRTADAGFAAKTLVANSDVTYAACVQYRLASERGGRFPAALQDAVTTYVHLVKTLGIPESKIIFSGDSAGANLSVALLRYITFHGDKIGVKSPAAVMLWSVWAHPDKSVSIGPDAVDVSPNVNSDYITGDFGTWGAFRYTPHPDSGLRLDSPYISLHGSAFETKVPIYFSAGECEVLLHDIVQLFEEFRAVKGNRVAFQQEEHAVHDIILVGHIVDMKAEAKQMIQRGNVWLREVLKDAGKPAKAQIKETVTPVKEAVKPVKEAAKPQGKAQAPVQGKI